MKFNLKQLEAFIWVSDLGSFRKAAHRLNTTQPNISARISALESALDVVLMERDAGSVRLTPKGQALVSHARSILNATDLFAEAADQQESFQGVLRLGVTEMIVHSWLRDFLTVLKTRYPGIAVELAVDLSINIDRQLAERSIDIAFQSGPFQQRATASKPLGTYELIWVASPMLGLHQQASVTLADLVQYPLLTHARDTTPFADVSRHLAEHAEKADRLVPSTNLSACVHMAQAGLGVCTIPQVMVKDELASGELVRINYGWVPDSLQFWARYDADRASLIVERAAQIAEEVAGKFAANWCQGRADG